MATAMSEALLENRAEMYHASSSENSFKVYPGLSETDTDSYQALKEIFYAKGMRRGSDSHEAAIRSALASPLHSDASKEYFTASHLSSEFILVSAGQFLTERVIYSYVASSRFLKLAGLSYFAALMESEHLSERIVLVAIRMVEHSGGQKVLSLIPDVMITSAVINNFLAYSSLSKSVWTPDDWRAVALQRIKEAHPEYADMPDDWSLKLFCGE